MYVFEGGAMQLFSNKIIYNFTGDMPLIALIALVSKALFLLTLVNIYI